MKLTSVEKPHPKAYIHVSLYEVGWLRAGIKKLLNDYPNSDPLIDILFDLQKIEEEMTEV